MADYTRAWGAPVDRTAARVFGTFLRSYGEASDLAKDAFRLARFSIAAVLGTFIYCVTH